jgi:GNAT superfamily N-acetyltransferase
MHPTFLRATPEDVETLVAVQIAAFNNDAMIYPGVAVGGPPGYDSVKENLLQMHDDDYYKILVDGEIVGGIIVAHVGGGHFHIGVLYIHPDYHGQGIGSAALQFIESTYPARRWTLNTPSYATRNHRFYEKHGYVKTGEHPFRDFSLFDYEKRITR